MARSEDQVRQAVQQVKDSRCSEAYTDLWNMISGIRRRPFGDPAIDRDDMTSEAKRLLLEACDKFDGRGNARQYLVWYVKRGLWFFRKTAIRERCIWSRYSKVDCIGVCPEEAGGPSFVYPVYEDKKFEEVDFRILADQIGNHPDISSKRKVSVIFRQMVKNALVGESVSMAEVGRQTGHSREIVRRAVTNYIAPTARRILST